MAGTARRRGGEKPIDLIRDTRPILIVAEPPEKILRNPRMLL